MVEKVLKEVINIDGESKLIRDKNSKALLSTDNAGLLAYKMQRSQIKKVAEYENDINTLKSEIKDMRTVLDVIVKKLNN